MINLAAVTTIITMILNKLVRMRLMGLRRRKLFKSSLLTHPNMRKKGIQIILRRLQSLTNIRQNRRIMKQILNFQNMIIKIILRLQQVSHPA